MVMVGCGWLWLGYVADINKQTVFFLQTADLWSTSSPADVCRCGSQTADLLPLQKQTQPKFTEAFGTRECISNLIKLVHVTKP
ncbi:hypothetical protein Hanom_Chr16g01476381 [Helianthus anomalus]